MKKNFVFCLILFMTLNSWSQTMYVKLKKTIEDSQSLLHKVNQEFSVEFTKSELTSKLLNAHVYKVSHTLNTSEAKRLHRFLKNDQEVLYASFMSEPIATPNDIPPVTPNFTLLQSYLDPDPGIDAIYAWDNGADGSNISVHVIEYGINVNHEEFAGRAVKIADGMTVSSEVSSFITEHGTATAGIIVSDDGNYGTKGIAYNAREYILYPEWEEGIDWDRINAVSNAIANANPGDVIVYEMQWVDADGDYVPAEYDPLVWDLTKAATENGLVVVAAAGNGGQNLDAAEHDDYTNLGDSGAIIVGASLTDVTHDTYDYSTYGTRVNINTWGSHVFTTGYGGIRVGDDDDIDQYYTSSFAGTSSATAVSGGCITALQSFYHSISNGEYLSSIEMRDILMQSGIPQQNIDSPIGTFINMKAAMELMTVLSATNQSLDDSFVVYPNPANDFIKVKSTNTTGNKKLELYTYLGKLIVSKESHEQETELDISNLSQGVYLLKISSRNQIGYRKILKN